MKYQSPNEIGAAIAGFEYFGRGEIGRMLREAMEAAFPAGDVADV